MIFPQTHKEVLAEKERKRGVFALEDGGVEGALLDIHTVWTRQGKGATVKMLSTSSIEADVFHERNHLV